MDYFKRAKELHKSSIVIDAHLDLAQEVFNKISRGEKGIIKKYYLKHFKEAGIKIVVSSIFIDDIYLPEMALRMALKQVTMLVQDIEKVKDDVILIKTNKDLDHVLSTDKIGIMMSFEGLDPILRDIDMINVFYELGVRGAGLVWSRRNYVADGSSFMDVETGRKGGLTDFGVKVIKRLEQLGMFIDVSHLNDEGTDDVCKFASRPFIASHSNARKVNDIRRNLSDEHIIAIGKSGGVIGINNIMPIVDIKGDTKLIERMCDHIDHIKDLIGCDHIGFGFDICSGVDETSLRYGNKDNKSVDVLKNHEDSILITAELLRRGYSEEEVIQILGLNFLRIFKVSLC